MPSKHNAPTCFVRGLSYTLTDEALTAAFSAIAPVKRAFIVKNAATNISRGFGFVQFAFDDDARMCAQKLDGSELDGRKIRVEVASAEAGKVQAEKRKNAIGIGAGAAPPGDQIHLASQAPANSSDAQPKPIVAAEVTSQQAPAQTDSKRRSGAKRSRAISAPGDILETSEQHIGKRAATVIPISHEISAADIAARRESTVATALHTPVSDAAARLMRQQRSLALFGLPADFSGKRLWKRVRKLKGLLLASPSAIASFATRDHVPAGNIATLNKGDDAGSSSESSADNDSDNDGDAGDALQGKTYRAGERAQRPSSSTALRFPVFLPGSEHTPVAFLYFTSRAARDRAALRLGGHIVVGCRVTAVAGEDVLPREIAFARARLIIRNLEFHVTPDDVRAALRRASGRPSSATPVNAIKSKQGAAAAVAVSVESQDTVPGVPHEDEVTTALPAAKVDKIASQAPATNLRGTWAALLMHIGVPPPAASSNAKMKMKLAASATAGEAGSATADAHETRAVVNRGFAFLEFATRDAAAAALEALNATKINRRLIAVDWAVSPTEGCGTISEVDTVANVEAVEADLSDHDEAASSSSSDSSALPRDGNDEKSGAASSSDSGGGGAGRDESGGGDAPAYKAAHVVEGTTLFLRNLPFDADDASLYAVMAQFGGVRYARVVRDRETGRCKGTAFVQYYTKEGADNALEAAQARDNLSALPKDLQAAAAAGETTADARALRRAAAAAAVEATARDGGIKLGGRVLFALRAVAKDEATALTGAWADGREGATHKFDKRHTYLAYEGNIRAGSAAAEAMPANDLTKRETAAAEKRSKLKSPLFFVSPTRLSIRNLAKGVDDKALKALARRGAVEGMAQGLVDPTEGDPKLMPPRGAPAPTHVIVSSAKVVREAVVDAPSKGGGKAVRARLDADGVTGRSKGYGFVDFGCHLHALAALRFLNNNPSLSAEAAAGGAAARTKPVSERPRLIVEFALENVVEVKKHERRAAIAAERREALAAQAVGDGAVVPVKETATAKKKAKKAAAKEAKLKAPAMHKVAAAGVQTAQEAVVAPSIVDGDGASDGDAVAPVAAAQDGRKRGKNKLTFRERRDRMRAQRRERRERGAEKAVGAHSGALTASASDAAEAVDAGLKTTEKSATLLAAGKRFAGNKRGITSRIPEALPLPSTGKGGSTVATGHPQRNAVVATGRMARTSRRSGAGEDEEFSALLSRDGEQTHESGIPRKRARRVAEDSAVRGSGTEAEEAKHDRLVREYKAKLFAGGAGMDKWL